MSLRMGALYDALRTAQGVSQDDARKAAEEVADYDGAIAELRSTVRLLTWMVGTNIALTLIVLGAIVGIAVRFLPLVRP